MAINLRDLAISEVVVHQVPKRDRSLFADAAITFSDAAIPDLDPTRRNFFGERINTSLLERSFEIVPLPGPVTQGCGAAVELGQGRPSGAARDGGWLAAEAVGAQQSAGIARNR
jgi:hypothetical protein